MTHANQGVMSRQIQQMEAVIEQQHWMSNVFIYVGLKTLTRIYIYILVCIIFIYDVYVYIYNFIYMWTYVYLLYMRKCFACFGLGLRPLDRIHSSNQT